MQRILFGILLTVAGVSAFAWYGTGSLPPEAPMHVRIVLTEDGFEPREVWVARHGSVTFSNATTKPFWPASDSHPDHGLYSEFDPKRPLQPHEEWNFVFDASGDWGYHDHVRSYYTGVIHVAN